MLQRAASNAYSWWWASHIRTKQSKWLEQNLEDVEAKMKYMLKLIEEDGDSFAKRAEMYYRKRPELINFVEESYRAYRALADRYDHISRELQNANNTIATVFPEKVQFAIDDEEEDGSQKISSHPIDLSKLPKRMPEAPQSNIPKVLKIPKRDSKGQFTLLKKKVQPKNTTTATSSQMSKVEALEEIDKLQKGILALQTEKEFVKESCESGLAKYWEIEKQITEMQKEVCSLQDEFSTGMVIEDDEARKLMAATALKSCQDTLIQLQEKQERSAEESRIEYQRIKDAHEKLEILKDAFFNNRMDQQNLSEKEESMDAGPTLKILEQEISHLKRERIELESIRKKIREHFETNSNTSLTVTELAEKIDDLVTKVISLELAVSSQTALIKRLKLETDELHAHLKIIEEDKVTVIKGSGNLSNKLRELEEELHGIQNLNRNVEDQNNHLQTHFTDACCNLDHISEKLQGAKELEEEGESTASVQAEVGIPLNVKSLEEFKEQKDMVIQFDDPVNTKDKITEIADTKEEQDLSLCVKNQEEDLGQPEGCSNLDDLSEKCQEPAQQDEVEKQNSFQTEVSSLDIKPQEQAADQEDLPNWQQLFLNGLEDREKILLAEYTSILRNYKSAKKKLSELEKKNRESLFETTVQIRELQSANSLKDEEIQYLRQKLNFLQKSCDENLDTRLTEFEDSQKGRPEGSTSQYSNTLTVNSDHQQGFNLSDHQNVEAGAAETPFTEEEDIKVILVDELRDLSIIEEKFRRDIDELLEQNLEFWLRFSTSFHQIQKFHSASQDLQAEFSKLKQNRKQEGSTTTEESLKSDARPIYEHLREIQTELTVWLEQSVLLKDELKCRFSSLCNIQEEISRVLKAGTGNEVIEFTSYQAAKFQGEVLNMQQENNKVADELQAGIDHVRGLKLEIEKTLLKLTEDFKLSGSKNHHYHVKYSLSRTRIPLRSFIFGAKPKKQKPSIFSCMNPALQKQYSDLRAGLQM